MLVRATGFFIFFIITNINICVAPPNLTTLLPSWATTLPKYITGKSDKVLIKIVLENLNKKWDYNNFIITYLSFFEGKPYGGGGKGAKEGQTVINFEEMDCVTFIENMFGLALTLKNISELPIQAKQQLAENPDAILNSFVYHLNLTRYYNGYNCGWEDRITYFTDALYQLKSYNLIWDVGSVYGSPFTKKIDFMSRNPSKFSGTKDWAKVKAIEKRLSNAKRHYYPLDQIDHYDVIAQTGDIVALTTNVEGLEVSHCGFITSENGVTYMTHASSINKKVTYKENLCEYLSKRTSITGIMVFRPKI